MQQDLEEEIVMRPNRIAIALLCTGIAGFAAANVQAQSARTLEEVKAEAQARADRNGYPLIGLKPEEVREALGRLRSLDRDEWAASWSEIGDRYAARADLHAESLDGQKRRHGGTGWRGVQQYADLCCTGVGDQDVDLSVQVHIGEGHGARGARGTGGEVDGAQERGGCGPG